MTPEIVTRDVEKKLGWSAFADQLEDLEKQENNGRGISCVRTIIFFLRKWHFEDAEAVYQNEGDKIRSYPEINAHLQKFFGCRLHLNKNCNDYLCKDLDKTHLIDPEWHEYVAAKMAGELD